MDSPMEGMKKCPFYNVSTRPMGARIREECNKTECRFCLDGRCIIIASYFMLNDLTGNKR
jgi:hypothetical protein